MGTPCATKNVNRYPQKVKRTTRVALLTVLYLPKIKVASIRILPIISP